MVTWIVGSGAFRAVDDGEGAFEDGGEGEENVETAGLDLAVYGGAAAGHGGLGGGGGRRHGDRSC